MPKSISKHLNFFNLDTSEKIICNPDDEFKLAELFRNNLRKHSGIALGDGLTMAGPQI